MTAATPASAIIAGLNHDLMQRKSTVVVVWDGAPDRHLFLPVPFGCSLADLPAEAETALRTLAAETASLKLRPAP